jgi:hypothetical protein
VSVTISDDLALYEKTSHVDQFLSTGETLNQTAPTKKSRHNNAMNRSRGAINSRDAVIAANRRIKTLVLKRIVM